MTLEVTGELIAIMNEQQITESFKKREFVVKIGDNPQYTEVVKFELQQDKTSIIDSHSIGSMVTVSFNLCGRMWTDPQGIDKYFNTVKAWQIK